MKNPLQKYIDQNGLTITSFSTQVKLPVSTIWRYVNGKFKPNAANALKIEQATNGQVTLRELLFPDKAA